MRNALVFLFFSMGVLTLSYSWTLFRGAPDVSASVTVAPLGPAQVVALAGESVILANGQRWGWGGGIGDWFLHEEMPVPIDQVVFVEMGPDLDVKVVDSEGNYWEKRPEGWANRGQPPVSPMSTPKKSLSELKAGYED